MGHVWLALCVWASVIFSGRSIRTFEHDDTHSYGVGGIYSVSPRRCSYDTICVRRLMRCTCRADGWIALIGTTFDMVVILFYDFRGK